ncbi:uncharacterized protein PAF06_011765 [Gastrophryne carolinensis]
MDDSSHCIPLQTQSDANKHGPVCIFGTGDFGRSLGLKLLQCGYPVIYGSRNPSCSNLIPKGAEVLSHEAAAKKATIIIIAIHRDHYGFLASLNDVLSGKVLVDVSNNLKINQYLESNAEYLASLLPGANVVKAFNTVSAWALQSGTLDASRQVFLCGDNSKAKESVMEIVRSLGLTPLDQGSLLAAKEIENYPLQLFPMWRLPCYICAGLTILIFLYCLIYEVIQPYATKNEDTSYMIMITIANRVFPIVSLILLALVYLPGVLAAMLQLYRGTKYSRFPDWLDKWMLCRKQLGLVALAYAFLHAIYTLVIPIRYYVRWWADHYLKLQITSNTTYPFLNYYAWLSDSYVALGILGFFFYVLLGITSLPSVSNAVNWREFRFVQSKLGYLTLVLCTAHTLVYGGDRFIYGAFYRWYMPPSFVISLIIPCAVLAVKFILVFPCIDQRITKIRQGWERKGDQDPKMKAIETNLMPLSSNLKEEKDCICIFGTGDFGQSLGLKLIQSGFSVLFGSRYAGKTKLLPQGVQVLSHEEAARRSGMIILAIQRDHYGFLQNIQHALDGKVLVDVSNNLKVNQYPESNAEYLAQMVPGATVVKAFNTVSAWALQSGTLDASRQVFVCSNDKTAKQTVMDLVRAIGLTPLDKGSLAAASEVENSPLQLFPMWRLPIYICAGLTVLVFLYCLVSDVVYSGVVKGTDISFRLAISIPNKVFPIVSLMLLALVYLPGVFAAIIQLYRGTKYSRFPDWLDRWMLCRKQLGLVALAYAFLHAIYTLVIPIRYYVRYRQAAGIIAQVQKNETKPFQTVLAWRTDSYIALGILGFFFYVLLGITSLPSVSNAINWREFRFVQSKLGYVTLVLCTGHAFLYGWDKFLNAANFKWYMPPAYTLSLVIPCVVLILKLILVIPCIDKRITKIRQGWDRRSSAAPTVKKIKNGAVPI